MPEPDFKSGALVSAAVLGSEITPVTLVVPLVTLNVPLPGIDRRSLSFALMTFVPVAL